MTLFAPVNEAFAELPGFAMEWLLGNPEVLTGLLLLHVVKGAFGSADPEQHGYGGRAERLRERNGRDGQ